MNSSIEHNSIAKCWTCIHRRARSVALVGVFVFVLVCGAHHTYAQSVSGPPDPSSTPPAKPESIFDQNSGTINPFKVIADASQLIPGSSSSSSGVESASGHDGSKNKGFSSAVSVVLLLTVITLAPSILLMTTSFVRMMIVLSLLRQAMGTQSLPPPQVLLALAMFMTALVMGPTIDRINAEAVEPYRNGEITNYDELWVRSSTPVRDFMFDQIEATGNWSSLYMMLNYRGIDTSEPASMSRADVPTTSLVPAFMLSELKTAFLMGFRIYLPFLVIDIVISAILISMGMMMLPPVLISLPFKLLLFVMVDGWQLIVGSLMTSFVTDNVAQQVAYVQPVLQHIDVHSITAGAQSVVVQIKSVATSVTSAIV